MDGPAPADVAKTETGSPQPTLKQRSEATLAEWRERWPAVFTKPVPVAIGISRHIRAALQAAGEAVDRRAVGTTIHHWTMHGAYLRAVIRGDVRRNLDGSEAGVPDEAARQHAQKVLDERAARRAERERQKQEKPNSTAAEMSAQDRNVTRRAK
jgi:sRNA-binding protein